ncbi:hypothetical protein [Hyphomicrobium sp.]|uniref:hypothetical protein n=1 Tax=Hyphomicrobium sp. TaxID=82 RepID=UPI002E30C2CB|nr:hypothetical protein [Hyphomicrobium sp.]HEX2843149.1 hypothetical protein [Hyphomicrobium sp.]
MTKTLATAIAASILLLNVAPAFAADAAPPTTKAECKKMADMKWDSKTHACVKK